MTRISLLPKGSADVLSVALPWRSVTVPRNEPLSRKSASPMGVPPVLPAFFTVAVSVIGFPKVAGLGLAVSVVRPVA